MNQNKLTLFERTLQRFDEVCRHHALDYIVIGGMAVMHHLEYRATKDIDISLCLDLHQIRPVGEILLSHFRAIHEKALDFFERFFVLPLVDPQTNIRLDVSAGLGGFERLAVQRGKRVKFSDVEVNMCTVEDLIIFKLVAARPIDLADAEMLIQKYLNTLDKKYLLNIACEFTHLERSDVHQQLQKYLDKYKT